MISKKLEVIDLFCWIWWLSHWLYKQWFDILAWIDFENSCKFWYEYNNNTEFIHADIRDIKWEDLKNRYGKNSIKVLVWCAPCQPFSNLNVKKNDYLNHEKAMAKSPLDKYASLIEDIQPDIISMENVRWLAKKDKYPSFKHFLDVLERNNYHYEVNIVDSKKYWIPQNRYRLILLASKLGKINIIPYTHEKDFITVKEVISHLPKIKAWEISKKDTYHRARKLSDLNMRRIKSMPKDGWNLLDGDSSLITPCHRKNTWKSYVKNIYARMRWNEPAPLWRHNVYEYEMVGFDIPNKIDEFLWEKQLYFRLFQMSINLLLKVKKYQQLKLLSKFEMLFLWNWGR